MAPVTIRVTEAKEMETRELDELRGEMRELWERDRLLWYCTLPYAVKKIFQICEGN